MSNLSALNPQQRQAVETINGPVLILAGAGTGKTRVITFRIAHMVAKGIAQGNILGVTFTNKAAREMQERVKQVCSPAPLATSPGSANAPKRQTLCTFHSLCVRILRQHIEKLGYKRNFVIYDESEQLSAVKKILSHISAKGEKTDPAGHPLGLLSRLPERRLGAQSRRLRRSQCRRHGRARSDPRYESALRALQRRGFRRPDSAPRRQRLFSRSIPRRSKPVAPGNIVT